MSYGIPRVHWKTTGSVGFYGYQPLILKLEAPAGKAFTEDTGNPVVEGDFQKAVRAIQLLASPVYLGERDDAQFCVIIDGATANAYVSSNADTDVAAAVAAAVQEVCGWDNPPVVTDITGLAAGSV